MLPRTGIKISENESVTSFPEMESTTVCSSIPISIFKSKLMADCKSDKLLETTSKETTSGNSESIESISSDIGQFGTCLEFGANFQSKETFSSISSQKEQLSSKELSGTFDFSSNESQFLSPSFLHPRSSTPTDSPNISSFGSDLSDGKLSSNCFNNLNSKATLNQPTRVGIENELPKVKTINSWDADFVNSSADACLANNQFSELSLQQTDECESTTTSLYTTAKELKTPDESVTDATDVQENKNSSAELISGMLSNPESSSSELKFSTPNSSEKSSAEYFFDSTPNLSLFTPFDSSRANLNSIDDELSVDPTCNESFDDDDIYTELSNFLKDASPDDVSDELCLSLTSLNTEDTPKLLTEAKESSPQSQEHSVNIVTAEMKSKEQEDNDDFCLSEIAFNPAETSKFSITAEGHEIESSVDDNMACKDIFNGSNPSDCISKRCNEFKNSPQSQEHSVKITTEEIKSKEHEVNDNPCLSEVAFNTVERPEFLATIKGNEIVYSVDDNVSCNDISNKSSPSEFTSKRYNEFINFPEYQEHTINATTSQQSREYEENLARCIHMNPQELFKIQNNVCINQEKETPLPNPLIIYVQNNKSLTENSGKNWTEESILNTNEFKEGRKSKDISETKTINDMQKSQKKRKNSDHHLEELPNKRILKSEGEQYQTTDEIMNDIELFNSENAEQRLGKVTKNTTHDLENIRPHDTKDVFTQCNTELNKLEQGKEETMNNENNLVVKVNLKEIYNFENMQTTNCDNRYETDSHHMNNNSSMQDVCDNKFEFHHNTNDADSSKAEIQYSIKFLNEKNEEFKEIVDLADPISKKCRRSSKRVSKENSVAENNIITNIKNETTTSETYQHSPTYPYERNEELNINHQSLAILNEETIRPFLSTEVDEIEILESSEMETLSLDSSDFTDDDIKDSPRNFFQMDTVSSPLEELFEVDKLVAQAVIKAISYLSQQKGVTISEILNFIKQQKLVRFHSKQDRDIRRFLKVANEVGIIQKVGLKYQLNLSSKTTSKKKPSSRSNELKNGIKQKKASALKIKTPVSRRSEIIHKKPTSSPKFSAGPSKSKSSKKITSEKQEKKIEVFKKLRSRVIIVDSD